MDDVRRQFRAATILILIVLPIGVIGYMAIEGRTVFESVYLTIITLTTIGYGDVVPMTELGRVFTLGLVFTGLGALAFFLSSSFALLFSAEAMARRRKYSTRRKISRLNSHYIICGQGEMVDKTIGYVLTGAQIRRMRLREAIIQPVDRLLNPVLGPPGERIVGLRRLARQLVIFYHNNFVEHTTLLDLLVVVTDDSDYAEHLRSAGILVIDGDPTDDDSLLGAGIARANAIMVMLNQDTEGLLTVLTARNLNPRVYITAAAVEEELKMKMLKSGANVVLAPYEVSSQFLNSATLRPAVNDYFNSILFDQAVNHQITQLELEDNSPWIGKRLSDLNLRADYDAGVIGIQLDTGDFVHAPTDDRLLAEDEILLVVAPGQMIPRLQSACKPAGRSDIRFATVQRLVPERQIKRLEPIMSLAECESKVRDMSKHFVICGNDHIIQSAVRFLDPARPFVLITSDEDLAQQWIERGFRVIHGNSTREDLLRKAGVQRAQAIMISLDDKAAAVLTVLSARSISKSLLIAVTARSDDMIDKLRRTGADRVVSPFHVAAQFVLLSTTRPQIADFMQHVLYNEITGLETAELYMESDTPWIGQSLASLRLGERYGAGVIGIRHANGSDYHYAPAPDYILGEHEVLIVITPMRHFDEMRADAAGGADKRPATLRLNADLVSSGAWSRDVIRDLIAMQEGG